MHLSLRSALEAFSFAASSQLPLSGVSHHDQNVALYKERPELPGGTPLSLCDVSSKDDLFQISSVELTKQPVYIEDDLLIHVYGVFRDTWQGNATMNATVDCGSHCEMYGVRPGDPFGESWIFPYCEGIEHEQPRGSYHGDTCPPVPGSALVTSVIYAWRWAIGGGTPGWLNFTFDAKTAEGDRIFCITAEVCLRWEDEEENKRYPTGPWGDCRWPR